MDRLYCCYSPKLKKFLLDNGVKYDLCCKNINTNNTCWVYIKDFRLDKLLTEWTLNKQL